MVAPLLASLIFYALPAKLDALFLYRTSDERTTCPHPKFTLTPTTFAFTLCVISWAKSAGKTTYSDFGVIDFHNYSFTRYGGQMIASGDGVVLP